TPSGDIKTVSTLDVLSEPSVTNCLALARLSSLTSPRIISISKSAHSRSKSAAASPIPPEPAMKTVFVIFYLSKGATVGVLNLVAGPGHLYAHCDLREKLCVLCIKKNHLTERRRREDTKKKTQ